MNEPITETEEARRGALIRELLDLKPTREHQDRVNTETDLGLFRIMERIVKEGK